MMPLPCKLILLVPLVVLFSCQESEGHRMIIADGSVAADILIGEDAPHLIEWAAAELATDIGSITGAKPQVVRTAPGKEPQGKGDIYIGTCSSQLIRSIPGSAPEKLEGQWESFRLQLLKGNLVITGSDVRGTVYGIFEVAERLGVSPWKWWADVVPEPREELVLHLEKEMITGSPDVRYRGIFLNDEDWGLHPWAAKNFEPETGDMGPKTYEKIFQLLLRLKGNTLWPAMHPCTKAFYTLPGNREMAQKYHMVIGTSHAEPMLRNNVDEWDRVERGDYNYFTNAAQVNLYWEERISGLDPGKDRFVVTVGMRGIHDGKMEGDATMVEQVDMMQKIIGNQRGMLASAFQKAAADIPQVFVPYKEVLGIYDAGLSLPEDITLMWTDDNYGYIRRLSNEREQMRAGGSGVYYHLSYWGRPHDYLWLSTTQPGLIWYEMTRAYHNGARRIWIANVGDIKPAEYTTELFLDLAWDTDCTGPGGLFNHLKAYAAREFGASHAAEIASLLEEYYRLAFLRKPEFMGWSRTEPTTATTLTAFNPHANGNELQRRIDAYQSLYDTAEKIGRGMPGFRRDAYFQLVEYPVKGAARMNHKFLHAHLACLATEESGRQHHAGASEAAYEEIGQLTSRYNHELAGGKWKHMMDMEPRGLPAYRIPGHLAGCRDSAQQAPASGTAPEPVFIQAAEYQSAGGISGFHWQPVNGLGYSNRAVTLFPLRHRDFSDRLPWLAYSFGISKPGRYIAEIRCLPTHANQFDHTLSVSVDGHPEETYALNTRGRSEAWKENVLRNYQAAKYPFEVDEAGVYRLTLKVNQTGIVIDQLAVYPENTPPFYEIPAGRR